MRKIKVLAIAALASLAACTISNNAGTTTLTINLVAVADYAQATKNGVAVLESIPALTTAIGPAKIALINLAVADMASDLTALEAADGGQTTLQFSASSPPSALSAFQHDSSSILANAGIVFTAQAGTFAANVNQTISALQTILDLAEAVGAQNIPAKSVDTGLSPDQALSILGVPPAI